jgi:hypothetical protein
VAKPSVTKTGGPSSPKPSTPSSIGLSSDKARLNSVPGGPALASAGDTRRSSNSTTTPSAPRAQLANTNGTSQATSERPNDTRLAMGRSVTLSALTALEFTRTSLVAFQDQRSSKESDQTKAANHLGRMPMCRSKEKRWMLTGSFPLLLRQQITAISGIRQEMPTLLLLLAMITH